jgi:hypothetical protein
MIGTTISQYKIVDKLGQGGTGEAYLAASAKIRLRHERSGVAMAGEKPSQFRHNTV